MEKESEDRIEEEEYPNTSLCFNQNYKDDS